MFIPFLLWNLSVEFLFSLLVVVRRCSGDDRPQRRQTCEPRGVKQLVWASTAGRDRLSGRSRRSRRIEIVELLGFRKNKGNVVALIAPGIQVHRGKENAVRAVENESQIREIAGNAEARSEVVPVRIEQPVGIAVLSANENLGRAALESKVRVGIGDVVQRPGVFVAQAHFDGRRAGKLEAVLEEAIGRPRAKLHLRNAGLALLPGGQTGHTTGEGGSAAVVCAGSWCV